MLPFVSYYKVRTLQVKTERSTTEITADSKQVLAKRKAYHQVLLNYLRTHQNYEAIHSYSLEDLLRIEKNTSLALQLT